MNDEKAWPQVDTLMDDPVLAIEVSDSLKSTAMYLAVSLQHRIRRAHNAAFSAIGISITHYAILVHLEHKPYSTASELAQWLSLRRQTISELIINLVERGFIQRPPHPTHGRKLTLELTPAGTLLLQSARTQAEHIAQQMCTNLTSEDQKTFISYLSQCLTNLPEQK